MKTDKNADLTDVIEKLHQHAMRLAHVVESVACKGTVIEKRTVTVNKRAFVFLGTRDAMLKLGKSLPEAWKLAEREPERFRPSASGWTKITFTPGSAMPVDVLKRWIDESYGIMSAGQPAMAKKSLAKAAKKKATGSRSTKKKHAG